MGWGGVGWVGLGWGGVGWGGVDQKRSCLLTKACLGKALVLNVEVRRLIKRGVHLVKNLRLRDER